MIGQIA